MIFSFSLFLSFSLSRFSAQSLSTGRIFPFRCLTVLPFFSLFDLPFDTDIVGSDDENLETDLSAGADADDERVDMPNVTGASLSSLVFLTLGVSTADAESISLCRFVARWLLRCFCCLSCWASCGLFIGFGAEIWSDAVVDPDFEAEEGLPWLILLTFAPWSKSDDDGVLEDESKTDADDGAVVSPFISS